MNIVVSREQFLVRNLDNETGHRKLIKHLSAEGKLESQSQSGVRGHVKETSVHNSSLSAGLVGSGDPLSFLTS